MTARPSAESSPARASATRPIRFQHRLLAEVVRQFERDGEAPIHDPDAVEHARAAAGSFERRIITRARALHERARIREAIGSVHRMLGWLTLLLIVLGAALGALTVRTLLAEGNEAGRVNFYVAFSGMLGLQTLTLLIWLVAITIALRSKSPNETGSGDGSVPHFSLGALVLNVTTWLARKLHSGLHNLAAVEAIGRLYATGRIGRWALSSITHGFWTSFNVGMLIALIILLGTRHYIFVWETTILSERQYVHLTRAISAPPDWLGFITPTEDQIAASRWTGEPLPREGELAREAWSSLLVGSLVLYGFAPRLLLLGLSLGLLRHSKERFQLDLARPGYARLEPMLIPAKRKQRKEGDGAALSELHGADGDERPPPRPRGQSAIVGLEIERPQTGWPPALHGITFDDLGIIETGDAMREVVEQLTTAETEPGPLVIVCSLTTTPDRGIEHALHTLTRTVSRSPVLVLTAGEALRKRQAQRTAIDQRLEDWHHLAERIGLRGPAAEFVLDLDLDHLTDASSSNLKATIERATSGAHEITPEPPHKSIKRASHLKAAFESIEDHADSWLHQPRSHPTTEQQARLHREIAQHYDSESTSWKHLFTPAMERLREHPEAALRNAASRIGNYLPDRLRLSAKWAAAGAMTGALGCIAASLTISPIAIGALPAWSTLGGTIAGIWRAAAQQAGGRVVEQRDAQTQDRDEEFVLTVRSATLFAALLELQGNDEATITRILDRVFSPDEPASLNTITEVSQWLDDVHRRIDAARQAEGAV